MHLFVKPFCLFLSFLLALGLQAQTSPDTTIYEVADYLPYPFIPSCRAEAHPGWNLDSTRRCGEAGLFTLLANNILYPDSARRGNLQGTVVVSFLVEKDGQTAQYKILKDIGGGCGPEAVRVLTALNKAGMRWMPAQLKGKPVRMRQSLPVRFRLQEALPYYLTEDGDSIYTTVDADVQFRGGLDSLTKFVVNRLEYPTQYRDSCKTGLIEMSVLVRHNGELTVLNNLDFNNLGMDFQWQAMRMVRQSAGRWTAARYQDKPVGSLVPLRALFKSDRPGCAAANDRFDRAMVLSNEATALLNDNKSEEALQKMNAALALDPNNAELLYYRGTALLNLNRREEACKDYNKIHQIMGITWFEPIRRLMCGW